MGRRVKCFLKRLQCFFAGHRMVKHAEEFEGKLYHTEDICRRCATAYPVWPGSLVKAMHHDENYEPEWQDLF